MGVMSLIVALPSDFRHNRPHVLSHGFDCHHPVEWPCTCFHRSYAFSILYKLAMLWWPPVGLLDCLILLLALDYDSTWFWTLQGFVKQLLYGCPSRWPIQPFKSAEIVRNEKYSLSHYYWHGSICFWETWLVQSFQERVTDESSFVYSLLVHPISSAMALNVFAQLTGRAVASRITVHSRVHGITWRLRDRKFAELPFYASLLFQLSLIRTT